MHIPETTRWPTQNDDMSTKTLASSKETHKPAAHAHVKMPKKRLRKRCDAVLAFPAQTFNSVLGETAAYVTRHLMTYSQDLYEDTRTGETIAMVVSIAGKKNLIVRVNGRELKCGAHERMVYPGDRIEWVQQIELGAAVAAGNSSNSN